MGGAATNRRAHPPNQMKTAIQITIPTFALALAFAGFALAGWLAVPSELPRPAQAENLAFELQNGSFSSLAWPIVQFKLLFSARYGELLSRAQEFQRTLPSSERAVVSARIAEMLEETLAEAQNAVPLEAMQEHLRRYYRATGLTNRPAQTLSRTEPRMAQPEMHSTRSSEETNFPASAFSAHSARSWSN